LTWTHVQKESIFGSGYKRHVVDTYLTFEHRRLVERFIYTAATCSFLFVECLHLDIGDGPWRAKQQIFVEKISASFKQQSNRTC